MDTIAAQLSLSLATYLAAIGLLGLLLGWWLGRSGVKHRAAKDAAELELRLEGVEIELEQAALEVGRLADQLAGANIAVEEAREDSAKLQANLDEVEAQLTLEQQSVASFQPLLEKRDERLEALRAEQSTYVDRIESLASEGDQSRTEIESLADKLATAEGLVAELEASSQRAGGLESELEAKSRENAGLAAEVAGLQTVAQELRQSLARSSGRDEDLGQARRQLAETGEERDRLVTEMATLSRRLEDIKVERQTHDRAAEIARRELETQRQLLRQRDDQVAALEGASVGRSELEVELEGRRSELASSLRQVEELQQRVVAAEAARLTAEGDRDRVRHELEALISAPLIDVDRMATVKPVSFEFRELDDERPAFAPELLEVPRGAADDLQRIRGIGEVLAQTLNSLGIYHFRQIAGWSESDLQWVAAHIDTFPDRIMRDEWREQAAQLESEKQHRQV